MNKDDFEIQELFSKAEFEELKSLDISFTQNLEKAIKNTKRNNELLIEACNYLSISVLISVVLLLSSGAVSFDFDVFSKYITSLNGISPQLLIIALIALSSFAAINFANQE